MGFRSIYTSYTSIPLNYTYTNALVSKSLTGSQTNDPGSGTII